MSNIDKIADRVRKLLALAQSDNEHEAAAAAARASKLIAEHNLSEAQIAADKGEAFQPVTTDYILRSKRLANWKVRLAGGVARACDCRVLIAAGYGIKIIGTAGDIATARVMIEYLCEAMDRFVKHERDNSIDYLEAKVWGDGNRYVRSFRLGMSERLFARLVEDSRNARKTVEASASTSTALVLRDKRAEVARVTAQNSGGGSYSTSGASDRSGFGAGYVAGGQIGLNKQVGGGNGTKRLR